MTLTVIGSLSAIIVAAIAGLVALVTARTSAANQRRHDIEETLRLAQVATQAERDKILALRDERIEELTDMVKALRIEIGRLRDALTAAGVTVA